METTIQEFLNQGVFAFILTFVRIGTAATIMPGIGDSFTPQRIRLTMALALSFVIMPLVMPHMPTPVPSGIPLIMLIGSEFIIGLFFGTLARILISALDTAGMVISLMSGLGNAQLFTPTFAAQGSLIGAMLSVTGVVFLFAANLHHLLIYGLVGSYEMFPVGILPDSGGMAQMVSKMVAESFTIGVQLAAPFFIVSLMVYISMGILTRLMPQVQVFILALPMQITLAIVALMLVIGVGLTYWAQQFEDGMMYFLSSSAG